MHEPQTLDKELQHVAFLLTKHSDQVLQEQLGVGYSQLKILRILQHNPSVTQKQIADMLGQTEASISRQIKLMHAKGLLATSINVQSRREHHTTITYKGDRLVIAAIEALARFQKPLLESLTEKEQHNLHAILRKLHANLCITQHIQRKDVAHANH